MRRVSTTVWVCTGCNTPVPVPEGSRPVEFELTAYGEPPVRVIALDGTEVHRCSPPA